MFQWIKCSERLPKDYYDGERFGGVQMSNVLALIYSNDTQRLNFINATFYDSKWEKIAVDSDGRNTRFETIETPYAWCYLDDVFKGLPSGWWDDFIDEVDNRRDEQKLKDKELIPRIICDCWKHNCKHEKTCGITVVFEEEK